MNPIKVINRAVIFRYKGIVIIGTFIGGILNVSKNPAMILPIRRRLIELIICGLFSLTIIRGENRGCPINAKKIMRVL